MTSVLESGGYTLQSEVTDSPELFRELLEKAEFDVILADFNLRDWTAINALEILKSSGKHIPLIVVTGAIGDEGAAECLKHGAADYILKDRPARLPIAVERAVEEERLREERKRAEEALRESSRKYRQLYRSMTDGFVRVDMGGRIIEANDAFTRMVGYTEKELLGLNYQDLISGKSHTFDADTINEHVLTRGYSECYLKEYRRKCGAIISVEARKYLVQDESGNPCGMWTMVRDITERKQAEEAIRQSHAKLEQQTHQLRLLAEMGEMLQASSTPADAYAVTARFAQTLIPASSGAMYVHAASRDNLEVVLRWGKPQLNGPDFLAADQCWGLRTGKVHLVEDSQTGLVCRHLPEPQPAFYLCAPMIAHGETLGLLHLQMPPPDQPSSEAAVPESLDITWPVKTMAERLALALADMDLRETLRAQSICDPLTGWYNRRYMQETLEHDIRRASRTNHPLSLLMLDIDHFKEFNDSFGHEAGDVTLKSLCQIVKKMIRSDDIACRYGGDEFVLILPDSSPAVVPQRVEEMRVAAGTAEIQYQGHLLKPLTVSFGIAAYPADARTSHELLRAADTALFRAKSEGRNRVGTHGKLAVEATYDPRNSANSAR